MPSAWRQQPTKSLRRNTTSLVQQSPSKVRTKYFFCLVHNHGSLHDDETDASFAGRSDPLLILTADDPTESFENVGDLAVKAARILAELSYNNVAVYANGLTDWQENGGQTVKGINMLTPAGFFVHLD